MASTRTSNPDGKQQATAMASTGTGETMVTQRVIVMRHGDRVDHAEPLWPAQAERPWDPPLLEAGIQRAWATGRRLRTIGFPIHRVFVSPFLRCLQTAAEVIAALCAVTDDPSSLFSLETSQGCILDPSLVKVAIEYGLSEMLNPIAIGRHIEPPERWFPDIPVLEALLPVGTIDYSVERLYKELPQWGESVEAARNRYSSVIQTIADLYPKENLLMVTHGEAVGVSLSYFEADAEIYEVEYCAYNHLERWIKFTSEEEILTAEKFKAVTKLGQTGVYFNLLQGNAGKQNY